MNQDTKRLVDEAMRDFRRTGRKQFRKRQFNALCGLLNDIFDNEPQCRGQVQSIGFRQLTGYYRRYSHLKLETLVSRWRVLCVLFKKIGMNEPIHPGAVLKVEKL
ncbi:hypothetical protein I3260_18865 [Photobacterium damselae]|uniref:Uncharacterized protein n=1 Tax=Photobacterium damselae subsp. damselae TaxID=85581 RepID=A0A850R209_PHODD|nr:MULTISPECIES: hypothetical protein [Gammaproteobacteria]MCG3814296.1 hypothetical protein [Photobacterium damselae]MCG3861761.1 hypothetical protein [Psychrobacter sp. Ps5]MCG3866307.1 hypothetical protein [Photobacterium sp. Ph6]NVP02860.1 hypothetical protein [Photobacterium damselae subsp. damselae]